MTLLRLEVRTRPGHDDPRARRVLSLAKEQGLPASAARTARVYLIEPPAGATLDPARLLSGLLVDPVVEEGLSGAAPISPGSALVEIHPLPGVMDPAAQSVREAIRDLSGLEAAVSTGLRLDLEGLTPAQARDFASRALANPVIHQIADHPLHPDRLPVGSAYSLALRHVRLRGLSDAELTTLSREAHLFLSLPEMRTIRDHYQSLGREPTDIELETIAQTWSEHCVHKTLKSRVRYGVAGGLAQDSIDWSNRPGVTLNPDGTVSIDNLLKNTIAAATFELIDDGIDWALSVFSDNSGVVALDDVWAVNIKVETHNRPSAIEPYGGAATGAGGCIRDVLGTGLGSRPIANTDVFCVAHPQAWSDAKAATPAPNTRPLPPGVLHPARVLREVVAGVRDYGNRMGIPTVAGAVHVDDRYVGNPLVYCGCVGLIPRDKIRGKAQHGDLIVALGGSTGRDGVHGATFSSAELESTASTEFAHAVQIGNAIEEKRLLEAVLRARDAQGGPLFSAITDCGAGGFSSAVGEMGGELGATVHLDRAPLKYAGLSYTEIWISEAQERMILAVPESRLQALSTICAEEGVGLAVLGTFGTPSRELILHYQGVEVGRLDMHLLHDGLPKPTRDALWTPTAPSRPDDFDPDATDAPHTHSDVRLSAPPQQKGLSGGIAFDFTFAAKPSGGTPHASGLSFDPLPVPGTPPRKAPPPPPDAPFTPAANRPDVTDSLERLLSHPTIASKHWIVRQYDHEVQGNTVIKPLVGAAGRGPGDASVLEPVPGSGVGVALACGLQTGIGDPDVGGDPYLMALAAVDECVRNLVCVGADPRRIAILDNFCWPSCDLPANMAALVRACAGCYDAAKAYRTPFVSGKDSLNNQLRYTDPASGEPRLIQIPPTLLITGLGRVRNVTRCVTMDAKSPGSMLVLIGQTTPALGGSLYQRLLHARGMTPEDQRLPRTDLALGPAAAGAVAQLIQDGLVRAAHDCSEGGWLVALAEMLIATTGAHDAPAQPAAPAFDPTRSLLSELLSRGSTTPALGADISLFDDLLDPDTFAFAESPSRYILEIDPKDLPKLKTVLRDFDARGTGLSSRVLGTLNSSGRLTWPIGDLDVDVRDLARAWLAPLDW